MRIKLNSDHPCIIKDLRYRQSSFSSKSWETYARNSLRHRGGPRSLACQGSNFRKHVVDICIRGRKSGSHPLGYTSPSYFFCLSHIVTAFCTPHVFILSRTLGKHIFGKAFLKNSESFRSLSLRHLMNQVLSTIFSILEDCSLLMQLAFQGSLSAEYVVKRPEKINQILIK